MDLVKIKEESGDYDVELYDADEEQEDDDEEVEDITVDLYNMDFIFMSMIYVGTINEESAGPSDKEKESDIDARIEETFRLSDTEYGDAPVLGQILPAQVAETVTLSDTEYGDAPVLSQIQPAQKEDQPPEIIDLDSAEESDSSAPGHPAEPPLSRSSPETPPFVCDHCGKSCRTLFLLTEHRQSHNDMRIWKCDVCNKTFFHRSGLETHKKLHSHTKQKLSNMIRARIRKKIHDGKPSWSYHTFNDKIVEGTLDCNDELSTHRPTLGDENVVHGQTCPVGQASEVGAPQLAHTQNQNKASTSKFSKKEFLVKQELVIHMGNHAGGGIFVCSICGKKCKGKVGLRIHHRIHKKDEPCPFPVFGKLSLPNTRIVPETHFQERTQTFPETHLQACTQTLPQTHLQPLTQSLPQTHLLAHTQSVPETHLQAHSETPPETHFQACTQPLPKTHFQARTQTLPKTNYQANTQTLPETHFQGCTQTLPKANHQANTQTFPGTHFQGCTQTLPKTNHQPNTQTLPETHPESHAQKEDTLFTCKLCAERFPNDRSLKEHFQIHAKKRLFVCCYCGWSFESLRHLKKHSGIHFPSRPHKVLHCACGICGKIYQASYLKAHNRLHSGDRPYPCTRCKKRFHFKTNLDVHMGNKH